MAQSVRSERNGAQPAWYTGYERVGGHTNTMVHGDHAAGGAASEIDAQRLTTAVQRAGRAAQRAGRAARRAGGRRSEPEGGATWMPLISNPDGLAQRTGGWATLRQQQRSYHAASACGQGRCKQAGRGRAFRRGGRVGGPGRHKGGRPAGCSITSVPVHPPS
ncbi:hypothetical protein B0H11DRAFT_2032939, partial [Mycena galericulata]